MLALILSIRITQAYLVDCSTYCSWELNDTTHCTKESRIPIRCYKDNPGYFECYKDQSYKDERNDICLNHIHIPNCCDDKCWINYMIQHNYSQFTPPTFIHLPCNISITANKSCQLLGCYASASLSPSPSHIQNGV